MLNLTESNAVIFSTLAGFVVLYIQYKSNIRNKQISLAAALEVEIQLVHETQLSHLKDSQPKLLEKCKTSEPFIAWYGRDTYTIYESCAPDLRFLPGVCVRKVIAFYEYDSTLRGSVMAMCCDNFAKLPPERRSEHINDIFSDLNGKYLTAKDEAVTALRLITTKKRSPL